MSSATAIDKCAACGTEGGDSLKACTACFMVKYCNRDCQISHRRQHKKECKKRAAELYDEKLFREIEREECPICMLTLPIDGYQTSMFKTCCGKRICMGCVRAMKMSEGKDLCAFCRTPTTYSNEENISRTKNLMDNGNANAFNQIASYYERGDYGLPQDTEKANELYLKAGELGCAAGYYNLGNAYYCGRGVELDMKKAKKYWELAAMNGNVFARYNLGGMEWQAGNRQRSVKHKIIAAKTGHEEALHAVTDVYENEVGLVTKEEYADTLRAYQSVERR